MSDIRHCSDADLAELTLGGLDGPARADVLTHLEQCERCRGKATGFASTLDRLLLAVPEAGPADDIVARVMTAMDFADEEPTAGRDQRTPARTDDGGRNIRAGAPHHAAAMRRSRRRHQVLIAAAVMVLAVVGAIGLAAHWSSQPVARTATMFDSHGAPMGRVELRRNRVSIVVTRADGYAPLARTASYRLRVIPRAGASPEPAPLSPNSDDAWSGRLRLEPSDVARVEVVDPQGRVVCRATFSGA